MDLLNLRHPKFLAISALCGAMGVMSGYAIFLTYRQVAIAPLAEHAQLRFVFTLLITGIISFAIEWIRELIREGRIEHATHPILRTMGTFVIVLMFELFVLGFHTTTDLTPHDLSGATTQLLGSGADASGNWTLVFAAGLWVVVGALLAAWLSQSVREMPGTTMERSMRAGRTGIVGGLVLAPVVMGLYILGGRCLVAMLNVFYQFGGASSAAFQNPLPTFLHNIFVSQNSLTHRWFVSALLLCITLPLSLLATAAQKNLALFMACFFAMAAFAAGYPSLRRKKALRKPVLQILLGVVWILCLLYTLIPFCTAAYVVARQLLDTKNLGTLGTIILLAAVLWAVPGWLLGSLTPLLRRVASHPRNWAFVGYGSALLLIVATIWARAWWPLIPALAALAVGYMFQRGSLLYEYWPFAALCVAAGICGATSIAQHVTFTSEVRDLHAIDTLRPAPANQAAVAGRVKLFDNLSPSEQARAEASPNNTFVIIQADDGHPVLVSQRVLDEQSVKQVQQIWQDHAAEIQRIEDSVTQSPPKAAMPSAKDLPPENPYIAAAIAAANNPEAPGPKPARTAKTKTAPAPSADLVPNQLIDEMRAESPGSFPSSAKAQRNVDKQIGKVVTTPAPTALEPAAEPTPAPAPASSAKQQAAESDDSPRALTDDQAAKALELSLSGSLGFWVTVGLLACWSMEDSDEHEQPA